MTYASRLSPNTCVALDHCCGDGKFAQLVWGNAQWAAGCDFDTKALESAQKREIYTRTDNCDVSKRLPYDDAAFDLVFNNSALEHVPDVDSALSEIARVLKTGGVFAFNVLNHRYFEWWDIGAQAEKDYRAWQPFFHAWDSATWAKHLADVGLRLVEVHGYFDRPIAQHFAKLDYEFSGASLAHRSSTMVDRYHRFRKVWRRVWMWQLGRYSWQTAPEDGAGYFIKAVRDA